MLKRAALSFLLLMLMGVAASAQPATLSERQQVRYLKKIEKKNNHYIKQQEKKTNKLLAKLSAKETAIYEGVDSSRLDSTRIKNSFSKIKEKLLTAADNPEEPSKKALTPINIDKSFSTDIIPENADGEIKDYLKQQIITTAFLSDSTCKKCEKLKKQTVKAKENISKTAVKLERLKSMEAEIQQHQETLKKYGVNTPALKNKLKDIDKSCYYFKQGSNGFKDMYTNPAKGIENKLLKNLSVDKNFTAFQSKFNAISMPALPSVNGLPDMSGYQTKAQVQAMLPQNAQGITPEAKTQLIANLQNSFTKFTELRDEKPDLSLFKEKPDFKPNPYKSLPLRQRLVPGFTFQPQLKKLNEPIIIDVGATLGFKLTTRLTPMIGASTKIGLGKDIHHLKFSYEGIVVRSGVDIKLFYGFSFQGWYEATWKPYPDLMEEDKFSKQPQPSLIAGISNIYKISKKVNGTFMIGYDFFYNKHTPYTSPWVIRMGWQ